MNEQDLAKRFSHDVDRLLETSSVMDLDPTPNDYREALSVARKLAMTDFSRESLKRGAIRNHLMTSINSSTDAVGRRNYRKSSQSNKLRRRLLVSIASALALLLVISVSFPGGPVAAAQSISDGAKVIVLGAYSTAQKIEAFITGEPPPEDTWDVTFFPGMGVGGNGLPGTNPTVKTVRSYHDAQNLTLFRIRTPSHIPKGYTLDEIKLAPIWTGAGAIFFKNNPNAFLFYRGPGPDIVIAQQPVGTQSLGDTGVAVGQVIGFVTDGTLEKVEINGQPAAWADGRLLLWEQDGLSYIVGGLGLDLDIALRIAMSLH